MSLKTLGSTSGALPVPSPMLAASLGLRPETFAAPDEMLAAWNGNGQQSHTRNVASIKSAVRDFWAKKRPSLTGSDLTKFLAARHPVLFDDALKGVSGVNEKHGGMKASNVADYLRLAANESAPGVMLAVGPTVRR